jgi:5'-methylthioadenosine phosphorylase
VTAEMVVRNLLQNAELGKKIVRNAIPNIPLQRTNCPCHNALEDAIVTNRDLIPPSTREKLGVILDKYLPPK